MLFRERPNHWVFPSDWVVLSGLVVKCPPETSGLWVWSPAISSLPKTVNNGPHCCLLDIQYSGFDHPMIPWCGTATVHWSLSGWWEEKLLHPLEFDNHCLTSINFFLPSTSNSPTLKKKDNLPLLCYYYCMCSNVVLIHAFLLLFYLFIFTPFAISVVLVSCVFLFNFCCFFPPATPHKKKFSFSSLPYGCLKHLKNSGDGLLGAPSQHK